MSKKIQQFFVGILILSGTCLNSFAQEFPNRPLRMIVPLAAGGATDVVARLIADKLSEQIKQAVIVENRPGAQGMIGVEAAAKAAPDGYTLVFGSSTTMAAISSLYAKLPFDPIVDFAAVAKALDNAYNVLLVPSSLPVNSVAELIAYAKANPAKLNYGAGTASSRICIEMLKVMSGASFTFVPYKTSTQALNDLMGNQVQLVCEPTGSGMALVASGKLRAIAVTGPHRIEEAPGIAPVAETPGLKDYGHWSWLAFFTRAGTPPAVIDKLSSELLRVLANPEIAGKIKKFGFDVVPSGPTELAALQKEAVAKYAKIVKDAGITPE
jgi:tripartite-type tricarboxylate transporter receptor subunit TctC